MSVAKTKGPVCGWRGCREKPTRLLRWRSLGAGGQWVEGETPYCDKHYHYLKDMPASMEARRAGAVIPEDR